LRRSLNLHFEEFKIEAYFQTRFESVKTGFDHPQIKVNQQANQNSIRLTLPLSIDLKLFFKAFVYLVLDLKLFDDIQPQNH